MKMYAIGLAIGVTLTLALSAVSARDDKDKKEEIDKDVLEARKHVLDVFESVKGDKGDKVIATKAAAIQKKGVSLNDMMQIYKIKEKGGLGFGEKPDDKSGIEAKIIALQRTERGPPAATIEKEKDDLIKLAQLNIAMAEIAKPHFAEAKEGKGKKEWDGWLDDQKKASKALIEAVNKKDSKAVAKAAKEMLKACTDCHEVFRQ